MQRSSNGVLVLVLGILSVVMLGPVTGVPAWIIGNQSLRDIKEGRVDPSEFSIIQVGRILGMVVTIIYIVAFALFILFFLGIFALIAGTSATHR